MLVALVPLVWQSVVVLREGFFWQDDFRYVIRTVDVPLSLDVLFTDYNGHLMPGQFLLVWLVTAIAPLNFTVAAVPVLVLHGVAMAMFWRLLTRLFGSRWVLLIPFAAFTFSPLILVSTRWWAFALQLIPMLVAVIGAIDAQVRHVLTGRNRDLVYSLLWVFAGMLFWQKALVVVPVLFAVTAMLAPEPPRVRWALRNHWRSLAAHAGLLVVLAIGYAVLNTTDVSGRPTAAIDWLRLTKRMLSDTLVPGLFGGPWDVGIEGETAWAVPPLPVAIGLNALFVVLILAGLWIGGRRAGLAWLTLAGYTAIAIAMVGVARLWVIGSVIGGDPRYVADVVPIAILCASFAFLTPVTVTEYAPRPVRTGIAFAATSVLVVASVATTTTATALSDQPAARAYVQTLRSNLRASTSVVLYDVATPVELMNVWLGSLANVSQLVKTMPDVRPRFDEPSEDMRVVDEHGNVRPLALLPIATGKPGPTPNCGYLVGPNPTEIPLSAPVTSPRQVLRLSYFTGAPGTAVLRVGGQEIPINWDQGVHNLNIVIDKPFDQVTLWSTETPAGVCVGGVMVGAPTIG
ncbi:glycosyltransferase family 39 protein [Lentzea tibetensis]|uniref:Glycosyltransferase family 39 protein n=1 Tax=Lentzea tibetensis TaxID=2591470 RepID=A0A563EVV2_9PSEU|nr:glycosyltransferase family 39 protein [Lentzea tibetensis]TWP51809.1 glycosyltransferase family 39 protein [Lentzea tibetensis]